LAISRDAVANKTIEETARYLAIGISNLVWCLDADTIVVDAAFTEAWGLIEPVLWRHLPEEHELFGSRNLLLRPSALGGEAALVGAASLPLSDIFDGRSS
jgi:predicted NBD/HSP70 family sugar kinase